MICALLWDFVHIIYNLIITPDTDLSYACATLSLHNYMHDYAL